LCDAEWFSIIGRATDPAVIDEDQLVERRESIDERRIPVGAGRGEAIQHQKRLAIANSTITNLRAIDLNLR